jgi:hypothetical protein
LGVVRGDDLRRRAAENAKGGGAAPAEWGHELKVEIGGFFEGRFRGHEEGGKSGGWLFWDVDGAPCFLWGCSRLDSGFERERASIGDTVVVYRDENYKTGYEEDDEEPRGLGYGVAVETNTDPLPDAEAPTADASPAVDDDIPF